MTETQGIPGERIIALFLMYGLYLSAGWGGPDGPYNSHIEVGDT